MVRTCALFVALIVCFSACLFFLHVPSVAQTQKEELVNVSIPSLPEGWHKSDDSPYASGQFVQELVFYKQYMVQGDKKDWAQIFIGQPPLQYSSEQVFRKECLPEKMSDDNFMGLHIKMRIHNQEESRYRLGNSEGVRVRQRATFSHTSGEVTTSTRRVMLLHYIPAVKGGIWINAAIEQGSSLDGMLEAMEKEVSAFIDKIRIGDRYVIEVSRPIPSLPLRLHIRVKDLQADPKEPFLLVANQDLVVHLFDRGRNIQKLAGSVVVTRVGMDKTITMEQSSPFTVTLDEKGEVDLEMFLDFGAISQAKGMYGVHLPAPGRPLLIDYDLEFGYKQDAKFLCLAKTGDTISLDYIGVVRSITVKEFTYVIKSQTAWEKIWYGENKQYVLHKPKALSDYDDVQLQYSDKKALRTRQDRVKIVSNNAVLQQPERIDWNKARTVKMGDRVRLGDAINIYALYLSSDGHPYQALLEGDVPGKGLPFPDFSRGTITIIVHFLDGVTGSIAVSQSTVEALPSRQLPTYGSGTIIFGPQSSQNDFINKRRQLAILAAWTGVKMAISAVYPPFKAVSYIETFIRFFYTKGRANTIQLIQLNSKVVLDRDPETDTLVVTTLEGKPLVFDPQAGPDGVAVPEGMTGHFPPGQTARVEQTPDELANPAREMHGQTPAIQAVPFRRFLPFALIGLSIIVLAIILKYKPVLGIIIAVAAIIAIVAFVSLRKDVIQSTQPEKPPATTPAVSASEPAQPGPEPESDTAGESPAPGKTGAQQDSIPVKQTQPDIPAEPADPDTLYAKGRSLLYGEGRAKDTAAAFPLLKRAAEQGHAAAQGLLGWCYEKGQGVAAGNADALTWYRKAADQGDPFGEYRVGWAFLSGIGVQADDAQALEWFQRAAAHGQSSAMYWLGQFYFEGRAVSSDFDQARLWYQQCADKGNPHCQVKLGDCWLFGWGGSKDKAKALHWYRQAAEQGNAEGQYKTAVWLGNVPDAYSWYKKAADQGYTDAYWSMGNGHRKGYAGFSRDPGEAVRWYLLAYGKGKVLAAVSLAEMYETGEAGSVDLKQALAWYRKALAGGIDDAREKITELEARLR